MQAPVEKIDCRLAGKRSALGLLRATIAVLVVPLSVLTALVPLAGVGQIEPVSRFTVLLLSLCAGLVGLGIAFAARAHQHLRGGEQRPGMARDKIDPPWAGQPDGR
jgi:hypothetical protein